MTDPTPGWLQSELSRSLRPVAAPAGLWAKMNGRGPRRAAAPPRRLVWVAVGLFLLLASVDLLWQFATARGGLRDMTQPTAAEIASIASAPDRCDLYTADPSRIRNWIKSRSNIDIELPAHSPAVRIVGAKVSEIRGMLVASVTWESGEGSGIMLVWKNGRSNSQTARHVFHKENPSGFVSWSRAENTFAVAQTSAGAAREACLLCHPEGNRGI